MRESAHVCTRPELEQILPSQHTILVLQWWARLSEKGPIRKQIAFGPPLPLHPLTFRRILCHLLRVFVVRGFEAVALADDGRVSAATDGVQLPM